MAVHKVLLLSQQCGGRGRPVEHFSISSWERTVYCTSSEPRAGLARPRPASLIGISYHKIDPFFAVSPVLLPGLAKISLCFCSLPRLRLGFRSLSVSVELTGTLLLALLAVPPRNGMGLHRAVGKGDSSYVCALL